VPSGKQKPLNPRDDGGAGGCAAAAPTPVAAAVEDDEAFARRLQEEENQRFERERAESRRRAEEWRRAHDAMMFAADDVPGLDPFPDEDDDDERDGSDDEDGNLSEDDEIDASDADEGDEDDVPALDATNADADADAERRRHAARRARGRLAQMHRFFGAMHAHIHAAGRDARERGDLAALVLSDRDFTDQDYERLLTLDNVSVAKKGLSVDAMARRGVVTRAWAEKKTPSDDADAPRCAVCLESFSRGDWVSRLPCTHQYHRTCIERWLSSHVECPVCRVDLAGDERR
jgi:hypothetical protein